MLLVAGAITIRPETFAEAKRVALEHVHRSRAEPGCISHDVSVDVDNPLKLHFIERWESAEALRAHFAVKASRVFWKVLQDLAAEPGAMHIYDASKIKL
jgi:quinol monooxygenase YgiN